MAEYVKYKAPKGPKIYKFGNYSISTIEIKHLTIAYFMISLTLMALNKNNIGNINIIEFILVFLFSVGLGFVLHEFGHKFVAQYYGFVSEFRADFMMLFLSFIVAAITSFTFLAPGAVLILGRPTRRQNGIISIAGPVVNLSLAIIFIFIMFVFQPANLLVYRILQTGVIVNAFLGIFNMLPFWILDGKKVLAWNKGAYFIVMGMLIIIFLTNGLGVFA